MSKSPVAGAEPRMPAASEPIAAKSLRALRARAHVLKPVVWIASSGLTEGVLRELDRALAAHELIKIHAAVDERKERSRLLQSLCQQLGAEPVQTIGKMLVAFRARPQSAEAPLSSQRARRTAREQGARKAPTRRSRASSPPARRTTRAAAGPRKVPAATTRRVGRAAR